MYFNVLSFVSSTCRFARRYSTKSDRKNHKPKIPVPGSSGLSKPTVQYKPFRRPGPAYKPKFVSTPYEKMNSTTAHRPRRFSTPAPSDKPFPDCLQLKCNQKHFVKDCPISIEEEKRRLLKDFGDKRSAVASTTGRMAVLSNQDAVPNRALDVDLVASTQDAVSFNSGRYQAKLADTVDMLVSGDYGADYAALSEDHLQQCTDSGLFIQVLPMRNPIHMHLAMGQITPLTCQRSRQKGKRAFQQLFRSLMDPYVSVM